MWIHRSNKKILRKNIRQCKEALATFFHLPLFRYLCITVPVLCILLVLVPYGLSRMPSQDAEAPSKASKPPASFTPVTVPETINVCRFEQNRTETIRFEDYVKGVVAGEIPASFHEEALKAQSVAARTYSLARMLNAEKNGGPEAHPAAPLCDTTHCQVYRDEAELADLKGADWMTESWPKICTAVDATRGQLLYYDGKLVEQALFHSSSGGKTENAEDVFTAAVPYLVSVESPYEEDATHQNEKNAFSITELASSLRAAYPDTSFGEMNAGSIKILSRSSGGRVDEIQIGNAVLTGRQIREALELPSANFTISVSDGIVTFTSNGSGHGVGMSQYGADGMAKSGYTYQEILNHYYSGTEVW